MTKQQIAQLDQIEQWLIEILDSPEFKKLDYQADITLVDSTMGIGFLLDHLMELAQ